MIHVHPITPAPPGAAPYRLRYPWPYYAESLQIFTTKKEAEAARAAELIAAEFALKPEAELAEILRGDLERVANFGVSLTTLCKISGVKYATLASYIYRGKSPNPRIAARFHILVERFTDVANSAAALLPDSGGCGNPKKGRGGQPDIWMTSPMWRGKSS